MTLSSAIYSTSLSEVNLFIGTGSHSLKKHVEKVPRRAGSRSVPRCRRWRQRGGKEWQKRSAHHTGCLASELELRRLWPVRVSYSHHHKSLKFKLFRSSHDIEELYKAKHGAVQATDCFNMMSFLSHEVANLPRLLAVAQALKYQCELCKDRKLTSSEVLTSCLLQYHWHKFQAPKKRQDTSAESDQEAVCTGSTSICSENTISCKRWYIKPIDYSRSISLLCHFFCWCSWGVQKITLCQQLFSFRIRTL